MLFIFVGCCIVISDELLHGNETESCMESATWTLETPTCFNGAIKSVNIARSFCSDMKVDPAAPPSGMCVVVSRGSLARKIENGGCTPSTLLLSSTFLHTLSLNTMSLTTMSLTWSSSSSTSNLKSLDATNAFVDSFNCRSYPLKDCGETQIDVPPEASPEVALCKINSIFLFPCPTA